MNPFTGFLAGLIGRDLAGSAAKSVASGAQAIVRPFASRLVAGAIGSGRRSPLARAFRRNRLVKGLGRLARQTKVGRAIFAARRAQRVAALPVGTPTAAQIAPHMNYGAMMANMGNPDAHSIAVANAAQSAAREQKSDRSEEATQKKNEATKEAASALVKFVASLGTSITGLVGFAVAMHKFAEAVTESRRKYAELNGLIGNAFALLDVQKLQMDMRTAQGISGSTAALTKAQGQLAEQEQPIDQMVKSIENLLAITVTRFETTILTGLGTVLRATGFGKILEKIEEDLRKQMGADSTIAEQMMRDLANGTPWARMNVLRAPLQQVKKP
jgi:hypothetical protein